jgi:hypothetical protein
MRVAWRESAERFMRSFVILERGAWFCVPGTWAGSTSVKGVPVAGFQ